MRIKGFEIDGFRSVYLKPQRLGPFEKITLFIGPNNSGKSNALRFISSDISQFINKKAPVRVATDEPRTGSRALEGYRLLFDINPDNILAGLGGGKERRVAVQLQKLLLLLPNSDATDETIWLTVSLEGGQHGVIYDEDVLGIFNDQHKCRILEDVWLQIQTYSRGAPDIWLRQTLNMFAKSQLGELQCITIPTLRRIGSRLTEFHAEYGEPAGNDAIIDELAALAYPAWNKQADLKRFEAMGRFVNEVLSRDDVRIAIPHDNSTVNVTMDGRVLPIEALGTGIHEIVMMAARVIVAEDSVICIEEPESHLHPELQRKFMQFIENETSNQYFITTHSAHIMDSVKSSVYSVRLKNGSTEFSRSIGAGERRQICHELGYRPSDLLQSNCLIWVEGPTDRLYMNHWIQSKAPELVEGISYSIMFYGGRLLSHLSAEDTEVDDFVSLMPINRFPAIVIDSDRRKKGDRLNSTKKRIIREITEANGIAWVTKGKEIENYLSLSARRQVISDAFPKASGEAFSENEFVNALAMKTPKGIDDKVDKIRFARAAVSQPIDWTVLDLGKKVAEIITFIRRANAATHAN